MQETLNYRVTVHHEEDGTYWAEVDELPGCFASGETEDELWEAVAEAISLYLSSPGTAVKVTKVDRREVVSESVDAHILVC